MRALRQGLACLDRNREQIQGSGLGKAVGSGVTREEGSLSVSEVMRWRLRIIIVILYSASFISAIWNIELSMVYLYHDVFWVG